MWFFYGVFGLACLGACGIVLGYRVKLCAGGLFIIAVSTYRWNFIVMYMDDAIIHLLLFWLMLLPVGHTLTISGWWRQGSRCWATWRYVTVPSATLRCLLANVCLVYLVAGWWKLESPLWRHGLAVYATLRLPLAYTPELWGPDALSLLRVANYLALIIEPLLPILLTRSCGHPLKWLGLLGQVGFHLGILVTLRIPFANLALMATAVLFFRNEIMYGWFRSEIDPHTPAMPRHSGWAGRLALAFLLLLTLAMMRRLPIVGAVHKPAYTLLWIGGFAQDYQLFNWIDRKNYTIRYRVRATDAGTRQRVLEPSQLFPTSLRAILLQSYLHNVRWIAVPRQHRAALKRSILTRLAQRFCRRSPITDRVTAWSHIRRIHPARAALQRERRRFVMSFQCSEVGPVLCRTLLDRHENPACQSVPLPGPDAFSSEP